ncbi:MAG TPA: hypothetical protein VGO93_26370 [Candidatus Xenobia bacterium]|jgi:hypothetical protein
MTWPYTYTNIPEVGFQAIITSTGQNVVINDVNQIEQMLRLVSNWNSFTSLRLQETSRTEGV